MSKIYIPDLQNAVVVKVSDPAPTPAAPKEVLTQPILEENKAMSWFTDVRDETLKQLGVDTPAGVVEQVGKTVTGGIPSVNNNEVKQSQPLYVAPSPGTPPAAVQAAVQTVTDNKGKIVLMLVVGFFAYKLLTRK